MIEQDGNQWRRPGAAALSPGKLILAFAAVFVVVVIAAAIAIFLLGPRTPPPDCLPGQLCGGPPASPPPVTGATTAVTVTPTATPSVSPVPSPTVPAPTGSPGTGPSPSVPPIDGLPQPVLGDPASPELRTSPFYTDPQWGHTIYHPSFLTPQPIEGGGVSFAARIPSAALEVAIRVDAAAASVTPDQLRDQLLDTYRGRMSSLAADEAPTIRVHRPSIGHVPAVVATYRGDLGTAGSVSPVALVVMTATDGRITVAVTVVVFNPETLVPGTNLRWYRVTGDVVDPILKRFDWGGG